MIRRLLITGGAGCLGSNIIEKYCDRNIEILVIDNFSTGNKDSIENLYNVKLIEGSVSDHNLVLRSFEKFKPTHVIHSAAAYKDPENWQEDILTNVIGSVNITKASQLFKVKKLINFQTALCYGHPKNTPIPISEPNAPFTSYGISKTAGESYMLNSNLPVISLRLANILCPRLSIGPIPTFYQRLKSGQNCYCSDAIRDFIDFEDFFNLLDICLNSEDHYGKFNVSTGKGHSIKDVYDLVSSHLNIRNKDVPIIPIGDDDVRDLVLDPSLTEKEFGWNAKIEFKDMVHNQLKWYDNNSVANVYSHLKAPPKKT